MDDNRFIHICLYCNAEFDERFWQTWRFKYCPECGERWKSKKKG